MRNILLTTVTALLLASCGVYKPYSRPEEVKTDGLYGTDIQAEDTASIASLHWSELFTDTRLQSLIRRGLENNNDLNVARLKVVEAEATLMSSRLAYLPSVSLAPQGTLSSFDGSKTTKTYTLAASAEWELDLFGKLTNAKRGARAALEQSRAYRQAVQTQLIATIANSYYNLLMLDVQLDINRCTAESWSESLRTLELQKQFGNTTEAAVQQARANRGNECAYSGTASQETGKCHLLALRRCAFPYRTRYVDRTAISRYTLRRCTPAVACPPSRHPSGRSIAGTGVLCHRCRPLRLTLGGSAGWTNSTGAAIINPGRWLLSAVGSLTHPLFNRGRNIANLRIAKAQQQEALLSFQQSLLKAGSEVNDALAQWQTADRRLQLDGKQIAALRRTVESTRQLMEHSSSTTYLEVLTAQQSLLSAELTEANDHFDKIQGMINLYHALGGGSW